MNVPLSEMRHDEIRTALDRSGYGAPIASGNMAFSGFATLTDETSTVDDLGAARSHHDSEVGVLVMRRCCVDYAR